MLSQVHFQLHPYLLKFPCKIFHEFITHVRQRFASCHLVHGKSKRFLEQDFELIRYLYVLSSINDVPTLEVLHPSCKTLVWLARCLNPGLAALRIEPFWCRCRSIPRTGNHILSSRWRELLWQESVIENSGAAEIVQIHCKLGLKLQRSVANSEIIPYSNWFKWTQTIQLDLEKLPPVQNGEQ